MTLRAAEDGLGGGAVDIAQDVEAYLVRHLSSSP